MADVKKLGSLLSISLLLISVLITPQFSFDPVNVPRFVALFSFGSIFFVICAWQGKNIFRSEHLQIGLLILGFIIWSGISLFLSGINLTEGFFGVTGRQTGFLTYFSLASITLYSSLVSNKGNILRISWCLIGCGIIAGLYGLIQILNLDPVAWPNAPYSVFGLFGNPNFHSSFMGMVGSACFGFLIEPRIQLQIRALFFASFALSIVNIYGTRSQQGYLVLLSGTMVIGFFKLKSISLPKGKLGVYVFLCFFLLMAILVDLFQKAPWNSKLYENSVSLRGDYWRTGWKILESHPTFGVGPDGFRDYYRQFRDLKSATRPILDQYNDSAHNVFLDIGANGGFILLFVYCLILLLVIRAIFRISIREENYNAPIVVLISAWVAYLAQSIISINQIGLAVWGWSLSGLIIGYEINTGNQEKNSSLSKIKTNQIVLSTLIGVISFASALPLMIADASFRSTIKSGDVLKIEAAVRQWPQSVNRLNFVAQLFRENNFPDRSVVIAREAVAFNPLNFEAWRELSLQPNATAEERENALLRMRELDPFNPTLK
jgi:O-antigen ligase